MRRELAFLVVLIFFIAGCASSVNQYVNLYGRGLERDPAHAKKLYDAGIYSDPSNTNNVCTPGNCVCFVCDVSNSFYLTAHSRLSLKGRACEFDQSCISTTQNINRFVEYAEAQATQPVSKEIRPFMIGQGSTFADFGDANQKCGNQLDMSVRWLHAKSVPGGFLRTYPLPQKEVAECFLDIGKMPVYLLYSNGVNVDPVRAEQIALQFRDAGPVIIVAEVDFDSSNGAIVSNVQEQLVRMKTACQRCLIAVAPKMHDIEGLNKVFDPATANGAQAKRATDIVAFGINTRYSITDCSPGNVQQSQLVDNLYGEARDFANQIKLLHGKPSLIPYMLFDADNPTPKNCEWTSYEIYETNNPNNAYARFFSAYIYQFISAGVIGIAPYQYEIDIDPLELNCPDCKLSQPPGQPQEAQESWYNWCYKLKIEDENFRTTGAKSGLLPVIYPQKEGAYCDLYNQFEAQFRTEYPDLDFSNSPAIPKTQDLIPDATDASKKQRVSCEACVSRSGTFPYDVGTESGGSPAWCSAWSSEISKYSDDIDPYLIRAIIWKESSGVSGFALGDPGYIGSDAGMCTASVVTPPTNPNERCYDFAFTSISRQEPNGQIVYTDPSGVCGNIFYPLPEEVDTNTGAVTTPERRYCAFGLMQVLESPYWYHAGEGLDPTTVAQNRNRDIPPPAGTNRLTKETRSFAQECAVETTNPDGTIRSQEGQFNPFDPEHNICEGTRKLSEYIQNGVENGRTTALNLRGPLELETNGVLDENKVLVLSYYFGLHKYYGSFSRHGTPSAWANQFASQRSSTPASCREGPTAGLYTCGGLVDVTPDCRAIIGTSDFIRFTRTCIFGRDADGDYGSDVLAKYKRFVGDGTTQPLCREATCSQGVVQAVP